MSHRLEVRLAHGRASRVVGRLLELAALAGLPRAQVARALGQVEAAVARFTALARASGVSTRTLRRVQRRLAEVRRDWAR